MLEGHYSLFRTYNVFYNVNYLPYLYYMLPPVPVSIPYRSRTDPIPIQYRSSIDPVPIQYRSRTNPVPSDGLFLLLTRSIDFLWCVLSGG